MPLITVADDGKKSLRGLVVVIVQFTIFLDTLFVEKAVQGQGRYDCHRDAYHGFLHDYLMAEKVGRSLNQSCSDSFPRCPLSLFEYFRSYGTSSAANDAANRDEILEPSSIPEEIEPLKHSSFATRDDNGADHQMKMENDATSVRKKHPFGVGNEI